MNDILVVSFQSLTKSDAGGTGKLGYYIAKELSDRGRLNWFVVSSKGKFNTSFPSRNISPFSRGYLLLLKMAERYRLITPYFSRYIQEFIFDIFCQYLVNSNVSTIIATTAYLPRTFKSARKKQVKTIFIPGNPEENLIHELVKAEAALMKVNLIDSYTYDPRINQYKRALPNVDMILAHSSIIYNSYNPNAYRIPVISCPGILRTGTSTTEKELKGNSKIVFGYLAYSVLLKGLHKLIAVWNSLETSNAELIIGGPIDPSIQLLINGLVRENSLKNISFSGFVENKDRFYSGIDWLVCPSLADAGPLTVVEAIERDVPVIVSSNSGIKDYIREGSNGFIYENDQALANLINKICRSHLNSSDFKSLRNTIHDDVFKLAAKIVDIIQ